MATSVNDFAKTQSRFEKDAVAFDSIYSSGSEFNTWFNRHFRKPVFERFDVAVESIGDVTDKVVLDIGCGTGIYAVHFGSHGARKVVGVDFSRPMLELAQRRSEAHHLGNIC